VASINTTDRPRVDTFTAITSHIKLFQGMVSKEMLYSAYGYILQKKCSNNATAGMHFGKDLWTINILASLAHLLQSLNKFQLSLILGFYKIC
jgi:hypothetical protein